MQPDLILLLPKVNDKHHKQISGNVWFTVRRIFLKPEHGASETLTKMVSLSLSYLSACNNAARNAMPRLRRKPFCLKLAGCSAPRGCWLGEPRQGCGHYHTGGRTGPVAARTKWPWAGLGWGPGHQDPRPRGQAPPGARVSLAGCAARGLLPRAASATANPKGGRQRASRSPAGPFCALRNFYSSRAARQPQPSHLCGFKPPLVMSFVLSCKVVTDRQVQLIHN